MNVRIILEYGSENFKYSIKERGRMREGIALNIEIKY